MMPNCPKILAILPGFIPSTVITVVQPLLDLDREGFLKSRITIEPLAGKRDIEWADLVIFCRNVEPKYEFLVQMVRERGIPFVYDLDDNLFDIPDDSPLGRYHRAEERQAMLIRYVQQANLMRVYSEVMYQRCLMLNPKTIKITAPLDWRQIKQPVGKQSQDKVKVVYATSRVEDDLYLIFMPAVQQILKDYPNRVNLYLWGSFPSSLGKIRGIHNVAPISNYNKFINRFSQSGFDVGLAPLSDSMVHRSKTNNKFREYGACRIAGIYSTVEVYLSCVENGRTGLLVENTTESWYKGLSKLIEEPELRRKIKDEAYTYIRENYNQEAFTQVWKSQISQLLDVVKNNPVQHVGRGSNVAALPIPVSNPEGKPLRRGRVMIGKVRGVASRLWKEGLEKIVPSIRWFIDTFWFLVKVNLAKKL